MTNKEAKISLQCPMPKLDFEIITMGHGSGGILTQKLLDSGVFTLLSNPYLDKQDDGAILDLSGPLAFSSDSFVVSPIFFPGGSIGHLAVHGTVNDIAVSGAKPRFLSLSFIIEEGLPLTEFWQILNDIREAAIAAEVEIVTGDTKVVEKGKGDKIYINTSGIGEVLESAALGTDKIKNDDVIIISGPIASHGMAILSVREGLEFESQIVSDTTSLQDITVPLLTKFSTDIHYITDPTRGGVATVLNEVSSKTNLGIDISQNNLPILPQVSSACELLGLDPLYVANEGIFIAIVDRKAADDIISFLQSYPKSNSATIIGEMTSNHPRQVVAQSSIGGKRIVSMLPGDQLPRIC